MCLRGVAECRLNCLFYRLHTTLNTLRPALFLALTTFFISACHYLFHPDPGIGKPVRWSSLPNWSNDNLQQAWQAIDQQCPRMNRREEIWIPLCAKVAALQNPSVNEIRQFLQANFKPHKIHAERGRTQGLITGYYEPLLKGSLTRTDKYAYPVYSPPEEMLTIELADVYPSLEGMRLRGRLVDNKIVPYLPRSAIDGGDQPLAGNELLWIDDPYGSFFVQIQGSGRVQFEDGSIMGLDYADQNGHPYFAVGKKLVELNEIPLEEVSLFSIRQWLQNNPSRADEVLNSNASYVFFSLREDSQEAARGSLNVPLTEGRSLAVDKSVIPLGTLVWLDTTLPDGSDFQRLMVAQDTGGAIAGHVRADVFFGAGDRAERLAGEMKQQGSLFALLPLEN